MEDSRKSSGQVVDDIHLRPGSAINHLFDLQQENKVPCTSIFMCVKWE